MGGIPLDTFVIVSVASLVAAGLTLYSGFGLGTLLMPVFALFFPVEVAVAATALVHGANNIFKIVVVGKYADRTLILHFGIPAIIAAFLGATALSYVSHLGEIVRYSLAGRMAVVTPIKLIMGGLMLLFALFELLPRFRELKFDRKYLFAGGVLSGFFGGFSGHQGALRSAFLAKVGISTEAFVGTNAAIGLMVDMVRIATYLVMLFQSKSVCPIGPGQYPLILTGILAAFAGVMIGNRFLHKITMKTVQTLTGFLLLGIALALGSGVV